MKKSSIIIINLISLGSTVYIIPIKKNNYCSVNTLSMFNVKVKCNMSYDLYQDTLQTEVIGYSLIIQHEKDDQFLFANELIGPSSSLLFTLSKFGYYRITVFPVIGLSFDHTFLRQSDAIFHERIYLPNTTSYEITDPANINENDGKKFCNKPFAHFITMHQYYILTLIHITHKLMVRI